MSIYLLTIALNLYSFFLANLIAYQIKKNWFSSVRAIDLSNIDFQVTAVINNIHDMNTHFL